MSESTRTRAVAARVEPPIADALHEYAKATGQSVSSVVADLIRTAIPTLGAPDAES